MTSLIPVKLSIWNTVDNLEGSVTIMHVSHVTDTQSLSSWLALVLKLSELHTEAILLQKVGNYVILPT